MSQRDKLISLLNTGFLMLSLTMLVVYVVYFAQEDLTMNMEYRKQVIEQARELIRSVWTDDLDTGTQDELARIYDDLKYVFDEE